MTSEDVTVEGIRTAAKIIGVLLLFILFGALRTRLRKKREHNQEERIKPWEKKSG